MFKAEDFFELSGNPFSKLFMETEYVWEGLKNIKPFFNNYFEPNSKVLRRGSAFIEKTVLLYEGEVINTGFELDQSGKKVVAKIDGRELEGASIIYAGAHLLDDRIYIGKNVVIEPTALIKGPAYIGEGSEVRHGAYIRGDVMVGNNCVVGHATEIKSSAMLGGSKAGHFAYIGDSILGRVNLGAGTKLANLKMISSQVVVKVGEKIYQTGLRKFGAIIGDDVETGCNSVTMPGTLLGRGALLYPNGTARGYCPPKRIIKVRRDQQFIELDAED